MKEDLNLLVLTSGSGYFLECVMSPSVGYDRLIILSTVHTMPSNVPEVFCSSTLEYLEFQSMFLNVPEIDFHCKNTSIFSNFSTLHVHKRTMVHEYKDSESLLLI